MTSIESNALDYFRVTRFCRDLKPENLLMATKNDDANVKLGTSFYIMILITLSESVGFS